MDSLPPNTPSQQAFSFAFTLNEPKRGRERMVKTCVTCGKSFDVIPSNAERRINCSKECNIVWQKAAQAGSNNGNWKGGDITSTCPLCGKEFTGPRNGNAPKVFCSRTCADIDNSNKRKTIDKDLPFAQRRCVTCGSVFALERAPNGNLSNIRYCSSECRNIGTRNKRQGSRIVACIACGKEFRAGNASRPNAQYCSRECMNGHKQVELECEWCHSKIYKFSSRTGYKHHFCSDEHRLYWLNGEYKEPTQAEIAMQEILDDMGVEYEFQHPYGPYILDFALLDCKIDIEVDSEYHHALPGRPEHDARRDKYMYNHRWEVVRIPSGDSYYPEKVKAKIAILLDSF